MMKFFTKKIIAFATLLIPIIIGPCIAMAQQSNLSPNIKNNWVAPLFTNISNTPAAPTGYTGSQWSNVSYITDADLDNHARLTLVSNRTSLFNGCIPTHASASIVIGNASDQYNSGNYVAFVISNPADFTSVNLRSSLLENSAYSALTNVTTVNLGNGKYEIGGYTTGNYKYLQLSINLDAPNGLSCGSSKTAQLDIYNALHISYGNTINTATCNVSTALVKPYYNVSTNSTLNNALIDANTNNTISLISVLGIPGTASVTDNDITYPAGSFLGFKVKNSTELLDILSLDLINSITLKTYVTGSSTPLETVNGSNVLIGLGLLQSSDPYEIGFVTTKPANRIEISFSSIAGNLDVYHAIFKCFSEATPYACNTKTYLTAPLHPVTVNKNASGILNVGLLGENIVNIENIIDNNINNYATINSSLVGVGNGLQVSVKKALDSIQGGHFAGFEIGQSGLLSLDLINNIGVATYLKGNLQESVIGQSALLNLGTSLLSGDSRRTIGFKTDSLKPFDEIRLITNNVIAVNVLKQLRIYGCVVQKFCAGDAIECNTFTTLSSPAQPMYINAKHTSNSGLIEIGTSTNNAENVIDGNPLTFASMNMTAAVGTSTTFAVSDAINIYNQTSGSKAYVGFDIATSSLVDLSILNAIKIRLIKPDGELSNTIYSPSMLAGVNVLAGEQRQHLGIVATEPFIGAQLEINNTIGLNLGNLKIYGLAFQPLCSSPAICNESQILQNGKHPVVINDKRTGTVGLANVSLLGSNIENAWNVVDTSLTNYARITKSVGAFSTTSIAVLNPIDNYPVGTFAGFVVEKSSSILELDLLGSITINTYKNDILQESKTASSLLNLELLGLNIIGSGAGIYNLGFASTKAFDEIQIVVNDIVGLNLGYLNIYGAFVDTRSALGGGLFCFNTSPDFAVSNINKMVAGNLSTNDRTPANTEYRNIIADSNNPNNDIPSLNTDGTFTFTPTLAGKYNFDISVCLATQSSSCATERLSITVLDQNSNINIPVVNHDAVFMKTNSTSTSSEIIKVLHNDGNGNYGGTLGQAYIAAAIDSPSHGSLSINANGDFVYAPTQEYYGTDIFTYTVCETPSGLCESASVKITILPEDAKNSTLAVDDYLSNLQGQALVTNAATGILANDKDPENNIQTVSSQNLNLVDTGTFILNSDGSYTFTPVADFKGPAQFKYQIIDNGIPADTAYGTIHFLIKSVPDLTPTSFIPNGTFTISNSSNKNLIIEVNEIMGIRTKNEISPVYVQISKSANFDYSFNPTESSLYGISLNNANWELSENTANYMLFKLKDNIELNALEVSKIGINIQVKPNATKGFIRNTIIITNTSGGENNSNNNISLKEFIIE